jgi:hypothetical protein
VARLVAAIRGQPLDAEFEAEVSRVEAGDPSDSRGRGDGELAQGDIAP